jgi:hypothetical protein
MTEEEARAISKAHGWGYLVRKRKRGVPYIYAVWREKQTIKDRYISPLSRLPHLTEQDIVAKLTPSE